MKTPRLILFLPLGVLLTVSSLAYAAGDASVSAEDRTFVASVSQGGMFEVAAGKLAEEKGAAQDVKDLGTTEEHDHQLVGAKLKSIAASAGIEMPSELNAMFQKKLDALGALSGTAFDDAWIKEMDDIHNKDGAAFAKEAKSGTNGELRAFAAETHAIVERHLGALHASTGEK
jgi:putative membrane protein